MKLSTTPTDGSQQLGTHFDLAKDHLLAPANLDLAKLQSVLGDMMSHKIDYADLYFQYSRSESWGLEEGQVKSGNFSIDQGVGVRAVSGEKTAFAYSDDISLSALQAAAKASKAIASQGGEQSASS
jgi:TldD protein